MTNDEQIELFLKRLSMGKTSDVMNFSYSDTLAYIQRLKAENAALRERMEKAEAKKSKLNPYIEQVGLKGHLLSQEVYREMCLTKEQLDKYGGLKTLYGWHIIDPKLFDKPRDITESAVFGKCADECSEYDFCARDIAEDRVTCKCFKRTFLKRPPRSWCYVEGE